MQKRYLVRGSAEAVVHARRPRWLYRVLRAPWVPTLIASTMGVLLVGLLVVALTGVPIGRFDGRGPLAVGPFANSELENNVFNLALWVVWLPILTIGTAVVGRVWCGTFCPLRLVADAARWLGDRALGRGSTTPYLRLGWLLPVTFVAITFLVKVLEVQDVARRGALLFVTVGASAFVLSVFLRRGAWCRFLCPIGGWLARVARLSALEVASDQPSCDGCASKACVREESPAGRCPAYLNPSKLESTRHCLTCWKCFRNCPEEHDAMHLRWRLPGAELAEGRALDVWESVFVAGMLGMYVAVGHRSPALQRVPWAALFFGMIALAMVGYVALCALIAVVAGVPLREGLRRWGYVFLPLELGCAFVAFGDDALEFFGATEVVARIMLLVGLGWSLALLVPIARRATDTRRLALQAAAPVALALVAVTWAWLRWY